MQLFTKKIFVMNASYEKPEICVIETGVVSLNNDCTYML